MCALCFRPRPPVLFFPSCCESVLVLARVSSRFLFSFFFPCGWSFCTRQMLHALTHTSFWTNAFIAAAATRYMSECCDVCAEFCAHVVFAHTFCCTMCVLAGQGPAAVMSAAGAPKRQGHSYSEAELGAMRQAAGDPSKRGASQSVRSSTASNSD